MRCPVLSFAAVCVSGAVAFSAHSAQAETKVETVLSGLNNPTAVAIQPEIGAVFVSESGAGNVVRVSGGKAEPVLTGAKVDEFKLGTPFKAGPLGLAFFDKNTLLVGDGGYGLSADCIRVFALPEAGKTVAFEMPKEKLGPLAAADKSPAEGKFYGVAATKFAVFATAAGDKSKGWLVRTEVNGTKFVELKRFVSTTENGNTGVPGGLVLSSRGEVVVGQVDVGGNARTSHLSFYNANSGKLLLRLETSLADLTGLAYGPKTGNLYALDFAAGGSTNGGLFRLDVAKEGETQKLVATKVVDLVRPTALAFAPDGTLYLTVLGPTGSAPAGQLLKIDPGL